MREASTGFKVSGACYHRPRGAEAMEVLVTGGAGYVGSHAVVELLAAGFGVVVFDDFSNSHPAVLERIRRLTGKPVRVVRGDLRDAATLRRLFARHPVDCVLHFAGRKSVAESVQRPDLYWEVNVAGTRRLLEAMARAGVWRLVFSSSATVYGMPARVPVAEIDPTAPVNPYGETKLAVERLLAEWAGADGRWHFLALRYFNPVGAHESGWLGEDPRGEPANLMPLAVQVAAGRRPRLEVFGRDWPTRDGTGVRDYVHVVDLARGHLAALAALRPGFAALNLGTGRGYSVLEVVEALRRASGRPVPLAFAPRRPGDVAECYADPTRAERLLGWRAERDLEAMVADHWRWQQQNPCGYAG
ncbi:MAG: UDP-glucose 4-epimerase [Porticoccaceae bacterium]|nr:MAG: UDP-glucose 4-epimerase [Porticoccaceae bacterium]